MAKGAIQEMVVGENIWLVLLLIFVAVIVMLFLLGKFAPGVLKSINPFSAGFFDAIIGRFF